MEWLGSILGGGVNDVENPPPPCLGVLGGNTVVVTDRLEHTRCVLDWLLRERTKPPTDTVDVLVVDEATRPPPPPAKDDMLIVVVSNQPFAADALERYQQQYKVSVLHCPKSRYPAFLLSDFARTVLDIVQWKNTRPNGTVVFASDCAASKQLLLHLGVQIWLNPDVEFSALEEALNVAMRNGEANTAKKYSFIARPAHPPPVLSTQSLFASQLRMLQCWQRWRTSDCSAATPLNRVRLTRVSVSVIAKKGDLLETFGDEHPTLELWHGMERVESSRPNLTLKNVEPTGVSVNVLEVGNSVIRRNEKASLIWEIDLESAVEGDLLVRVFNPQAMLRIQFHAAFFHGLVDESTTSLTLPFENDEVDGYDLFPGRDALKVKLTFDLSPGTPDHTSPELTFINNHRRPP